MSSTPGPDSAPSAPADAPAPRRDPVAPARLEPPDLARIMGLTQHPEGGWYRETWRTGVSVTPPGYPGPRDTASGIYFLLGPGEESLWHVVRSAELWLWHRGGPLELRLGGDGTTPDAEPHRILLGPDVEAGEEPQVLIPPGVWQSARPASGREVLVSCVVSPAFSFEDFRML
ncbi:cupin domain-containing protein [Embleya scabrispora]|uniref:cupin domain-containing protein n=1 Tax=Embleya scabrispora TaxID=159449 RepID=UPI00039EF35D|nr:cupin domain-containing protein [Embleya scabrispora]MYS83155.1 cupin domain-containing protein [Streptomyces sp. SID5474]